MSKSMEGSQRLCPEDALRRRTSHPLTGAAPRSRGRPGRHCLCWCCWPSTTARWSSVCRLPETPCMGLPVLTLCTARQANECQSPLGTETSPAPRPSAELSGDPSPLLKHASPANSFHRRKLSSLKRFRSRRASVTTNVSSSSHWSSWQINAQRQRLPQAAHEQGALTPRLPSPTTVLLVPKSRLTWALSLCPWLGSALPSHLGALQSQVMVT